VLSRIFLTSVLAVPSGCRPIRSAAAQELETGDWIVDSGVIVDYLEKKFPEPKLGTSQDPPQMCVPPHRA
jgi:hypothetical protein